MSANKYKVYRDGSTLAESVHATRFKTEGGALVFYKKQSGPATLGQLEEYPCCAYNDWDKVTLVTEEQ